MQFHKQVCADVVPYRCTECKKCFTRKDNLRVHLKKHSGEYKCPHCEKQFSQNRHLLEHVNGVHAGRQLQCAFCNKTYITSSGLKTHMRSHEGSYNYLCQLCGETFIYKTQYDSHVALRTGQKWYRCACGKSFSHTCGLSQHMQVCAVKDSVFTCLQCGKVFTSKKSLIDHRGQHGDSASYQCPHC